MVESLYPSGLKVGYLMQNGAPVLSQVSGPQLHTLAVIRGLRNLGHMVRLVAFQNDKLGWSDDIQNWLPPRYGLSQNKIFRLVERPIRRTQYEFKLPFLGLFNSLRYADACYNHLTGFDMLYERHGYMGFGGVIAAHWLGIPLVLELNGNILQEIDERGLSMSAFQRRIGRWVTIQTFRFADRVVVVSEALCNLLVNDYHIPAEKISVVLNGVDLELFSRQYVDNEIRPQFGLSTGPVVGFVGSFEPWHGVDLLVSAFGIVERRYPDAQLVIIGEGPGKEKAVARSNELGLGDKVKFLGRLPQTQVAAVLGIAEVLVAPYPFEDSKIVGTPLKIMEYMAAGKGIVASTAPIHEMIEHEVTGLRVPPANDQLLAEGILRSLEDHDLSKALGKNAAVRAQRFSWEEVSRKLAEIFLEEINKGKRPGKRKPG